jgi:hypothetical protein
MSENFGLCPECKQGHLNPKGRVNVGSTIPGEIRDKDSVRDLVCDNCGHEQTKVDHNEEGGPPSEIVSGVVTKAEPEGKMFTCDCGASFKTNEELFKHHQSEHAK